MNLLSPSEAATVWFPEVVFENIASEEDWMEMLLSKEYNIVRNIEGNFDPVEVTDIDNAFMFLIDSSLSSLSLIFLLIKQVIQG